TAAWEPANFNHILTSRPPTCALSPLESLSRHANGYNNTPTECYACHQTDFVNADDPDHVASGFPTTCETCHTTAAWEPANFNHNQTSFPLTGAHTPLDCLACHANGYNNTPTDCYACHQSDYVNADDPDHLANGFPTTCETCHSTSGWEPSTFNHDQTNFPLTGKHRNRDCLDCHSGGYSNTSALCYSCHQSDYEDAEDHVRNNYPHTCEDCHNTSNWDDD
ncbi:MAG: cytochrome c3 family protein, partial [Acidobacteria bacterium]|nr:cytochrome c3 family protein [Acidobacteriota bacterium]